MGINDAGYVIEKHEELGCVDGKRKKKRVWFCPYYQTWASMLGRCYSAEHQERYPTYKGCTVAAEWLIFSNFKAWMEKQDFKGMHLDKDLLFEGNKVYSAKACVFVTPVVNSFTTDCGASRGEWLIGAVWEKRREKFRALCRNPFTRKKEHLGYFDSEQEAHEAWLKRKLKTHLLYLESGDWQPKYTDERVAKALKDCSDQAAGSKTQE